jgi:hypothetical protein
MKNPLVAIYLVLFCASPAVADDRHQLLGWWKLQTYDVEFQDKDTGERKAPFGANPHGFGVFTPEGRKMCLAPLRSEDGLEQIHYCLQLGISLLVEKRVLVGLDRKSGRS